MLVLLGLALMLHESVYFSTHGRGYFSDQLAPVLGLRLPAAVRLVSHGILIGCALGLILRPSNLYIVGLTWAVLSVIIPAFPRRVPNHLAVAWFILLSLLVHGLIAHTADAQLVLEQGGAWTARLIVAATYGLAALHKLNAGFFRAKESPGCGLVFLHLVQRGMQRIPAPRAIARLSIYGVVVLEALLAPLFLVPELDRASITIALSAAALFGLLGHSHFTLVMVAAIYGAATASAAVPFHFPTLLILTPAAFVLTLVGANYRPYRHRQLAIANYTVMLVLVPAMWLLLVRASSKAPSDVQPFISTAILLLFLLNGASPYLGLKQDFSLAMFSNLRPDRWDHFLIRAPRWSLSPQYVRLVDASDSETLRQALKRSDGFYSLGYVIATYEHVREADGRIPRIVVEDSAGQRLIISEHDGKQLRARDRVHVFPYWLPEVTEPLLS